jgi:hypothetical protein
LPSTITLPYNQAVAVPNCVAAAYGFGPFASHGFGPGYFGGNCGNSSLWG